MKRPLLLLFLFSIFLQFHTFAQCLSGNYTIGATNADFKTVQAAANALTTSGVCGPVVFKIANGKYRDGASLGVVSGASDINTITFESAGKDSSKVLLINKNFSSLYITGKYFIIKNISFIDSSDSSDPFFPGFSIYLYGDIGNTTISNCSFQLAFLTKSSIRIEPTAAKNILANVLIENSYFEVPEKYVGTNFLSTISVGNFSSLYYVKGIIIKNNFIKQPDRGILLSNVDSAFVIKNTIISNKTSRGDGVVLREKISNVEISGNKILNVYSGISSFETEGIRKKAFNNFIYATTTAIGGAIHDWDICHNTIHIASTWKSDAVPFLQGSKNIRFKNNIISKEGYGSLLNIAAFDNIDIDYNDYYSANDTLMVINSTIYTDFKKYQLSSKRDLHSLNANPNFVSATDLHLNNDLSLDNKGTPIDEISTDIDGQPRSKTMPDMGADEFNAIHLPNDAALLAVYSDTVCDAATSTVYVKLKNNGTNVLTNVGIKHTINNVPQSDFNWNGTLLPDNTIIVSINSFKHDLAKSFFFTANTFNPNGVTDPYPLNDTVLGANDNAFLTGTYEIGANTLFPTIDSAFKTLMKNGICSPVTFKIKDGVYNEKLVLGSIKGVSSLNTITFTSASKNYNHVIIDGTKDTTLQISGADYIIFNHLTFKNNDQPPLIYHGRSSEHITFDSIGFMNSTIFSIGDSLHNYNVTFSNCLIKSKLYFTHQNTKEVGAKKYTLNLINNNFFNSSLELLYIENLNISNNRIFSQKIISYSTAISIIGKRGKISITKNYIGGTYNNGIQINDNSPTLQSTIDNVIIKNNSISSNNITRSIACFKIDSLNIFYNSISCAKNDTSKANCALTLNSIKNANVKNNIFYNKYGYAADINSALLSGSDYNVFFTEKKGGFRYEGVNKTFNDFLTVSGSDLHSMFMNPNYLSTDDLHYTNDTLNGTAIPIADITEDLQNKKRDLTHPNPGAFEVKGDSIIDYTNKDLVLMSRDTVLLGTNKIKITFKNTPVFNLDPYHFYKGTIDTVDVSYEFNGQPKVTEQWIGKLGLNQSADYTFNTPLVINRRKMYPFTISAHIHSSTAKDINLSNNTISKPLCIPMAGVYTIGGSNPDFTTGDTAMLNLNACHEISAVTFAFRPGEYNLLTPQGNDTLKVISETGNAADVKINVYSLNASNITFKKATLILVNEIPGSKSIEGVKTAGKNIIIDSCSIKGTYKPSSNKYTNGFYVIGGANINITNNTFNNLNLGINYSGPLSNDSLVGKHVIANNLFDGINFVSYINSANIYPPYSIFFHHNKIRNCEIGIVTEYLRSAKLQVYNNEFTQLKKEAISIAQSTIQPVLFYNNFISGGEILTATFTGIKGGWKGSYFNTIRIHDAASVRFINNSIYGSIELYNNTSVTFDNNSVFSDTMLTIKSDNLDGLKGDYNNFYSNGKAMVLMSKPNWNNVPVIKEIDSLKTVTTFNQNSISYNPYYTSTTDLHSNSTFLKNKAKSDPNVTTDIDGQLRNTSNPDIGADEIDLKLDVVWPGDANGDSKVDNTDLLSIGLYNGSTGVARSTTGINWMPYESADWNQIQFNKVDYKHADSNGDGVINNNDTLAIFQNFGMRHNTNHKPVNPQIHSNYSIYFVIQNPQNTYKKGDVISAEVWLGKPNNEIQNCYGIAFNVGTYTSCVTPGTMKLNIQNNWLGSNQNSYRLAKTNENYGVAYGAIVRKDHTALNGYGKIAEFSFMYNGNSPSLVTLRFENLTAIDNTGKEMEIIPINEDFNVTSISSEKKISDNLRCSPNPFSEATTIQYELGNESTVKLELMDALGKNLKTIVNSKQSPGVYNLNLDAKENKLENGIYFIRLIKNENISMVKIVLTN